MIHSKKESHESLSPEECERLVLSPPPVAFNPEKLGELLSVNRAISAKHSLNSVNTNDSTPLLPRHVSIAWSRSEFDSKFKHYEAQIRTKKTNDGSRESNVKNISLASETGSESQVETVDLPSAVDIIPQSPGDVSPTSIQSTHPAVRKSVGWRSLVCCVSSNYEKRKIHNQETPSSSPQKETASAPANTKKSSKTITKPRNFSAFFMKKSSTNEPRVKLCSVQAFQQLGDERLKRPAPALLVTRHNESTLVNEVNHVHGDENGVAGYHLQVDDRMSESTNSRDSIRSDDSYMDPSDQVNPGEDLLGEPLPECIGKKCLVLDLDETLVHSSFKPVDNADFTVTVEIENIQHEVSVCKRPYLDAFIEAVCPLFEVVMFTASLSKYADPVCDRIDPSGHFKHRLFRESCVCFKSNYIKHLSVLGRDVEQICIIDNSPISFYFHRQNALQIVTWFDDPTDTALLDLIPYLKGLAKSPSVLEYLSLYSPPSSAAIAQPDLPPWIFGPPSLCSNNGIRYYDEEDEEEEVEDSLHNNVQPDNGEGLSANNIITMAPRPSHGVATAT